MLVSINVVVDPLTVHHAMLLSQDKVHISNDKDLDSTTDLMGHISV